MTVQSFNVPSSSGRTLVSHTGKGGFNSPRDGQYAGVAHGDAIGFKHREGFGPDGSTPYARTKLRSWLCRELADLARSDRVAFGVRVPAIAPIS